MQIRQDPYGDQPDDFPDVERSQNDGNRITDTVTLADGRVATIEQGRAYPNLWRYSGFAGIGYLVRIDGEPVPNGQVALRYQALDILATL